MASYYPPVGFHFHVKFNLGEGDADNRFQEVTGITAEITTEELKEGGQNEYVYKLPVKGKYGNLVFKRGMLVESKVVSWLRAAVEDFSFETTNILVSLLNQEHQPLATWEFSNAYPVKFSTSDLKAQDNALVVETMELAYQKHRRIK